MAAVTGAVVAGGAAAYSARQQRRAAEQGSTIQNDPWAPQAQHLENVFGEAQNLYNSGGPDFYQGATYTPFSPQTQQGLEMIEQRALNGNPLNQSAQNYTQSVLDGSNPGVSSYNNFINNNGVDTLSQTANGDFLNSNPYLDQTFNRATENVTEQFNNSVVPSLNATFGMAGRTGSNAHQDTFADASGQLSDTIGNMATDIYGGNYQQERSRQLSAASNLGNNALNAAAQQNAAQSGAAQLAPQLAETDYNDANRLLGVGAAVEGQAGRIIQDQQQRHDFYQNRPENNLAMYSGFVQGNYGGTQNTSGASAANPLFAGVGGGLAAYRLLGGAGSSSTNDPYGNQEFGYGNIGDPFG